jgi:tetratricopeptide (TPR) repeat protein
VNTGEVVVRSIATSERQTEYTPIGHSTSLAARMQVLAPTGSIATTDVTRKFCEGYFTFKSLGPTVVKGVSEPVAVYEVTGLGPLRTRLQRAAGRGLTKFVGREREMEVLRHTAELAKQGHGQLVAAMAEAGVGKSRLFYEVKAVIRSGWMVLEGFSVSHGKASAYLPLIDLLHSYFEIELSDDARKRREKVGGKVLMLDRSLEDSLPHLFGLLGIVEGDDPLAQTDPYFRRRRLQDAIKRILLRESLNQPLMIIFEDLHWIDTETQSMLNVLVDSIGTARVLLLVNYRPEYHHEWSNRTYYTQLRLDPLGRESAQEMLVALMGGEPAHALTQEVAYNSILADRRQTIHQRAGQAIETRYAERLDDHLSELARHHLLGNDPIKAVRYSRLAAERAANRAAYGEAAQTIAAALKLLDRLPEGTDRPRSELDLRAIENSASVALHGFASREHQLAVERVCELAEQLGEKAVQLRGLLNLANLYYARGEPMRSLELARRCIGMGADTELLAAAHLIAAYGAAGCGHISEAVSYFRDGALHGEQATQQAFTVPFIPWSTGAAHISSVVQLLGRGSEALELAKKGLDRARESQHLFSLGMVLTVVAWLYQYRQEAETVRTHAEAAIALAEEHGFPEWRAWGHFHHGWAMAELGHVEEGVSEIESGIRDFRQFGGVPRFPFTLAVLAYAYARLGRHDEALTMLDEALDRTQRTAERTDEAEMLRLKAEVLLMGDCTAVDDAERYLRAAIDVARAQEAKWWELRATTSFARLLAKQGRRDDACTMLAEIYDWFTEDFDTADLKDAKALLDELEGTQT